MSGNFYQQPPRSLGQLVADATMGGPAVPPEPAMATAPPLDSAAVTGVDPTIGRIIEQLSQPPPAQVAPQPAPVPRWQRALGGLADAASAYGRGLNPNVPITHVVASLLGDAQAKALTEAAVKNQNAQNAWESSQAGLKASLGLALSDREQQQADRVRKQQEEFQTMLAAAADKRARDLAAEADARQRQMAADRQAFEERMAAQSQAFQERLAKMQDSGEGSKLQFKQYQEAKAAILNLKTQAVEAVAKGQDPSPLAAKWADALDASDMTGDYRAAAQNFFDLKLGPILKAWADAHTPAANRAEELARLYPGLPADQREAAAQATPGALVNRAVGIVKTGAHNIGAASKKPLIFPGSF